MKTIKIEEFDDWSLDYRQQPTLQHKGKEMKTAPKTNAQSLHEALIARDNCELSGNKGWFDKWSVVIEQIMDTAPSGSGVDNGTELLDWTNGKIRFRANFHHMDEAGGYDGWTEHDVTVKPTFNGLRVSVSGHDRDGIKNYLGELFHNWLADDRD